MNAANINLMRIQRTKAVQNEASFAALSKLPEIVVPKLTTMNYEIFNTAFTAVVARTIGMNSIPLDYVIRETIGNYGDAWPTRTDKLKNCILFNGASYLQDRETLYSLYVQYVGTEGVGSNIINKHVRSKNGRNCHQDFESHFRNESYLTNKATAATAILNAALYRGDRRNFTLETYYTVMSKAFNDLAESGPAHALNDVKKLSTFEQGLQDPQAIQWSIISKERWDNFPLADQTFDKFYNEFSKYITKFKTLSSSGNSRSSRIGALEIEINGGRGSGRGRGHYRARGRGRGRTRGGGRGRGHSPYSLARPYSSNTNFSAEARTYNREEYQALTRQQQSQIQQIKAAAGWINGYTPPPGFTLDNKGYATPSTSLVSAVQAHIRQTTTVTFPLPPAVPPVTAPPIPTVIDTDPAEAGAAFGRRGSR